MTKPYPLPQSHSKSTQSVPSQLPCLLWITDPWETLDHASDTTLRLLEECEKINLPSYWSAADFLLEPAGSQHVRVLSSQNALSKKFHCYEDLPSSTFHQVHYRVDPPIDFNYLNLLKNLTRRISPDRIFSPPFLLQNHSEKLLPPDLASFSPLTQAIWTASDVEIAWEIFSGFSQVVLKPLHAAQSKGVKLLTIPTRLSKWNELLQVETQAFSQPVALQEYLPSVQQGEIRMWFAEGKFIAALKKFPKKGDFRVLIDEGSQIDAYQLNPAEQKNAAQVGQVLKKLGIKLAAIDWIDDKISDFNFTSPGLLVQLEKVHQRNFAREVLRKIVSGTDDP